MRQKLEFRGCVSGFVVGKPGGARGWFFAVSPFLEDKKEGIFFFLPFTPRPLSISMCPSGTQEWHKQKWGPRLIYQAAPLSVTHHTEMMAAWLSVRPIPGLAGYLKVHLRKLISHPNMTAYTYLDTPAALELLALNRSLRALPSDLPVLLSFLLPTAFWGCKGHFLSFLNIRYFCDIIPKFPLPCYLY